MLWLTFVTALGCLAWAVHSGVQPVSRRACNAAYVLWILAMSSGGLGMFVVVEAAACWAAGRERLRLACLEALNAQGLPVFLLANVLTGAVNLSMDTQAVGPVGAKVLVGCYLALLTGVAQWLSSFGVRRPPAESS